MIDYDHPLARAARDNDAEADGGRDILAISGDLGLDGDSLRHMAEQRALRVLLVRHGRADEMERLNAGETFPVSLSGEESGELTMFTAMYIDAITIGWRACKLDAEQ